MADWTSIRMNLHYHWKAVLLWSLVIGGILACGLINRADAWVKNDQQPFPSGEATVVVERFCINGYCDPIAPRTWTSAIQDAMAQWNNAGANFTFTKQYARSYDDPCELSGVVVIITFIKRNAACAPDRRVFDVIDSRWSGVTIYHPNQTRIYLNHPNATPSGLASVRRTLLHELGHVVGLGHPDEAGQDVEAAMNIWTQYDTLQPDDILGIRAPYGTAIIDLGYLESPAPQAVVSGIGFISGWRCDAQDITVRIDDGPVLEMSMEVLREDTRSECQGLSDNGFITQVNWNSLGAGTHTAVAYDNGIEFDRSTFTVGTTGEEFLHGVAVDIDVPDFPTPGQTSRFVWNQSTQHLELAEVYPGEEEPIPPPVSTTAVSRFNGKWLFSSSRFNMTCTIAQGVVACNKDWKLGTVSTTGDITIDVASSYFQGRLEGNAGAGTWIYYGESAEDGREWTATKQSSLASITSPVCGTLRGLQVEDYDDNFGRWDITNPCASWNGHSNVLHIDIIPLSPAGFDMDAEDLMIIQGNQVATYDEDTPDLSRSAVWVDRQTQVVEAYTILPYRLTEAPYRLTVLVGQNAGIDLRRPFVLLYAERVVAIFE